MSKLAVVMQGGGPTAVVNASLASAVRLLERRGFDVCGARGGFKGAVNGEFYRLDRISEGEWKRIARTPGAALGSTREKPSEKDCEVMLGRFSRMGASHLFYIGGEGSAKAVGVIRKMSVDAGNPLACIHVPKTVDNNLQPTDHSPGYGSAARFNALAAMGIDRDNASISGVHVVVYMGGHEGFLAAAAALGRKREDDGPHLVYLPEREFAFDKFFADVERVFAQLGRVHVAVAEGIWSIVEGERKQVLKLAAELRGVQAGKANGNGHANLSGSGMLADYLVHRLRELGGAIAGRCRSGTLGYPQRSFPTAISRVDFEEAMLVGDAAVHYATFGGHEEGSIVLERRKWGESHAEVSSGVYGSRAAIVPLAEVTAGKKTVPKECITAEGSNVTRAFFDYAAPLVGELPEMEELGRHRVFRVE